MRPRRYVDPDLADLRRAVTLLYVLVAVLGVSVILLAVAITL